MTPTANLSSGKRLFFYLVLLSPLLALVGGVLYLALGTSLVRDVYLASWRNLDLPCQQWTNEGFGYKGRSGACPLNNPEYQTVVSFDQEGFRNANTRQQADVILIGDSHTQGFGVRDQETFAALLHTRYHHRTKNLGMSSYATFRELEALKAYLTEEKVVVIQYCENDAQENKALLDALGDCDSATRIFRALHERDPGDDDVLALLERALRAGRDTAGLCDLLARRAAWAADGIARAPFLLERAQLLEGRAQSWQRSPQSSSPWPNRSDPATTTGRRPVPVPAKRRLLGQRRPESAPLLSSLWSSSGRRSVTWGEGGSHRRGWDWG